MSTPDLTQNVIVLYEDTRAYRLRKSLTNAAPAIVVFVLVLISWELLVRVFDIQKFLLPSPSSIAHAFAENALQLGYSAQMALFESLGGLVIGSVWATIAALLAMRWNVVGRAIIPFAIGFNAVPTLVFAPIMNNWFGSINPLSKMMVVVTLVYYPIMINVLRGLTLVNPASLELMRSYGASERDIFLKLRIPNALPYFINAMKVSATLSVIGTVVAGYFGGQRAALGVWILNQVILFRFPPAWAGILVACLIGIGFYLVVSLIERVLIPWHTSMREPQG
ncbi:MAG: ABC transporter permease [Anaerolineae bacterium]|nr:ABC transporter permease [Anaerolineae bacterium]